MREQAKAKFFSLPKFFFHSKQVKKGNNKLENKIRKLKMHKETYEGKAVNSLQRYTEIKVHEICEKQLYFPM